MVEVSGIPRAENILSLWAKYDFKIKGRVNRVKTHYRAVWKINAYG